MGSLGSGASLENQEQYQAAARAHTNCVWVDQSRSGEQQQQHPLNKSELTGAPMPEGVAELREALDEKDTIAELVLAASKANNNAPEAFHPWLLYFYEDSVSLAYESRQIGTAFIVLVLACISAIFMTSIRLIRVAFGVETAYGAYGMLQIGVIVVDLLVHLVLAGCAIYVRNNRLSYTRLILAMASVSAITIAAVIHLCASETLLADKCAPVEVWLIIAAIAYTAPNLATQASLPIWAQPIVSFLMAQPLLVSPHLDSQVRLLLSILWVMVALCNYQKEKGRRVAFAHELELISERETIWMEYKLANTKAENTRLTERIQATELLFLNTKLESQGCSQCLRRWNQAIRVKTQQECNMASQTIVEQKHQFDKPEGRHAKEQLNKLNEADESHQRTPVTIAKLQTAKLAAIADGLSLPLSEITDSLKTADLLITATLTECTDIMPEASKHKLQTASKLVTSWTSNLLSSTEELSSLSAMGAGTGNGITETPTTEGPALAAHSNMNDGRRTVLTLDEDNTTFDSACLWLVNSNTELEKDQAEGLAQQSSSATAGKSTFKRPRTEEDNLLHTHGACPSIHPEVMSTNEPQTWTELLQEPFGLEDNLLHTQNICPSIYPEATLANQYSWPAGGVMTQLLDMCVEAVVIFGADPSSGKFEIESCNKSFSLLSATLGDGAAKTMSVGDRTDHAINRGKQFLQSALLAQQASVVESQEPQFLFACEAEHYTIQNITKVLPKEKKILSVLLCVPTSQGYNDQAGNHQPEHTPVIQTVPQIVGSGIAPINSPGFQMPSVQPNAVGMMTPPMVVSEKSNPAITIAAGIKKKKLWINNGNKLVQHEKADGSVPIVKRIYYVCSDKSCSAKLIVKRCTQTNEVLYSEPRGEHTCGYIENAEMP